MRTTRFQIVLALLLLFAVVVVVVAPSVDLDPSVMRAQQAALMAMAALAAAGTVVAALIILDPRSAGHIVPGEFVTARLSCLRDLLCIRLC